MSARAWRALLGALMAAAATLAAARSWSEYRGAALLAQSRTAVAEADGKGLVGEARDGRAGDGRAGDGGAGDLSRVGDERAAAAMRPLRSDLPRSSVTADAYLVEALELVSQVGASLLAEPSAGASPPARSSAGASRPAEPTARTPSSSGKPDRRRVSPCDTLLRRALQDVALALRANPTSTKAWLAGYRVTESARAIGCPLSATVAGRPADGPELSRRFLVGAVRADPNGGELHRDLAALLLLNGDRAGAFEHYRRAARDLFFDPVEIATEMLDAGFPAEQVLAAMPDSYAGQVAAGRLLQSRSETALAERALRRAETMREAPWEAWEALSHLEENAGRHERALDYARRAFPALPGLPPAARSAILFRAAASSRSLGRPDEALESARRSVVENPANVYARSLLGTILLEEGDAAGAIREWMGLIENHAADPFVSGNLALIHRKLGQAYEELDLRESAIEHYTVALSASPDDAESRSALARLSRR